MQKWFVKLVVLFCEN